MRLIRLVAQLNSGGINDMGMFNKLTFGVLFCTKACAPNKAGTPSAVGLVDTLKFAKLVLVDTLSVGCSPCAGCKLASAAAGPPFLAPTFPARCLARRRRLIALASLTSGGQFGSPVGSRLRKRAWYCLRKDSTFLVLSGYDKECCSARQDHSEAVVGSRSSMTCRKLIRSSWVQFRVPKALPVDERCWVSCCPAWAC